MNQGGSSGRHLHHKQSYMFLQLETGDFFKKFDLPIHLLTGMFFKNRINLRGHGDG